MQSARSSLLLVLLMGLANPASAGSKQMSVQVETLQVREHPSPLADLVGYLSYGDRVSVLDQQNGWVSVRKEGAGAGWAHECALTPKKVVLGSGQGAVEVKASDEEVAFAGKGFNSRVEAEFKAKNPDVERQFALIDEIEEVSYSPSEIALFLKDGGVVEPRAAEGSRE